MKKFALKMSAFALVALTILNACKDDEASCDNGSFDLTVNAEEISTKSFNNTLVKGNDGGEGKRMDIRAKDSEGRELIITISDVSTGASGNGITTDDYVSIDEVSSADDNSFFFTIIEDDGAFDMFTEGTLDITACDADEKQVSGTFSFDADGDAISGTFTDMCYRIVK